MSKVSRDQVHGEVYPRQDTHIQAFYERLVPLGGEQQSASLFRKGGIGRMRCHGRELAIREVTSVACRLTRSPRLSSVEIQ